MADTGASDSLFQGIDSQTETQFIAAMTSTQYGHGEGGGTEELKEDSHTTPTLSNIKQEYLAVCDLSVGNSASKSFVEAKVKSVEVEKSKNKKPRMEMEVVDLEFETDASASFLSHLKQASPSSTKPPEVIQFCYEDYTIVDGQRQAVCRLCKETKCDALMSTSNFRRHTSNQHPGLFKQFLESKAKGIEGQAKGMEGQAMLEEYVPELKYRAKDAKQLTIKKMIMNYVINCTVPLSHVENEDFRAMISSCEKKFSHFTRKTARKEVAKRFLAQRKGVTDVLSQCDSVALTVDIWSDRKMRSFLGVTVHFIEQGEMSSAALACSRFNGRHTGENIKVKLDETVDAYGLTDKVSYVVSDNAANMAKAFSTSFPTHEPADVDGPELWMDNEALIEVCVSDYCGRHLRCFAHSLQLVINDGLVESKSINHTLAKCSKISSTLHSSTKFKECFEKEFGGQLGITQPIATRWNSTLRHIQCILRLDRQKMAAVMREAEKSNLLLLPKDYTNMEELQLLLLPFLEATNQTQGEKGVTVSYVIPSVVMLRKHLVKAQVKVLDRMRLALVTSLDTRFAGVLSSVTPNGPDSWESFGNEIFTIATLLDPNFNMVFFEYCTDTENRTAVKQRITAMVQEKMEESMPIDEEQDQQLEERSVGTGLFADFNHARATASPFKLSASEELARYYASPKFADPIKFWKGRETSSPMLAQVAMRVLMVPASSAPVERLFSSGGLVVQAKRSSMTEELLEQLVFLKCNRK